MFTTDATNLPRLMACNGSRLMTPSTPAEEKDTTIRDEGNAAHYMARAVYNNEFTIDEMVDRKAPNGVYMSIEMAEFVQTYLDEIAHGEMEVDTSFGDDNYRVNARADHIAYIIASDTLFIDDLKFGWSIIEPDMNWTLIAHAIGFCMMRQIAPAHIKLVIHQPRPFHRDGKRREWSMTYPQLLDYYAQIVQTMSAPNDTLVTGAQCRKCYALATCPAARNASMNAIDVAEMAFNDDIDNPSLAFEIDQYRRAKALIEQRLKATEELAIHRIKSGAVINGYTAETGLTNRQWKEGITADLLKAITGKDLAAKPKLITPTQAIKTLRISEDVIKTISERKPTAVQLVRIDATKRGKQIFGEKEE